MGSGESDARLAALYQRHYDEVLAYCTRRVGLFDAEDATADVFAVACRRVDDIAPENVRAWLFGVARGVLANRWRASRRRSRLLERVSGIAPTFRDLPDDKAIRRAEDQEVIDALRGMKAIDREVLMLAFWEELTMAEIAVALSISVPAVKQRKHRAEKRLAKALQDSGIESSSPRAAEERGRG